MRVVVESTTYRNRVYVLIDASEREARTWADHASPAGWTFADFRRVMGSYVHASGNRNYTVTFRKDV